MKLLAYRPEIDGLRAIAVLSVVFYHAKFIVFEKPLFAGGYFGVDIFFVISGYLIGRLLITEFLSTGRVFLINFYLRRIKRIFPMLLITILVSTSLAHVFLVPDLLLDFVKSAGSAILFVSNFFFYHAAIEYAAQDSLFMPLLHTWSLGIEEQFYIIFPIILLFLRRIINLKLLLLILFFISLLYSMSTSLENQSFGFYFTLSRVWEIIAGVLVASYEIQRKKSYSGRLLRICLQFIFLFVLVYAVTFWGHGTKHPGLHTFLLVASTSLMIAVTSCKDGLGKVLSFTPLNYLGKLSFSLYLWHFPLFAFGRTLGFFSTDIHKLFVIFVTLLLTVFSFHFFEQPMRNKWSNKYSLGIISTLAFISLAYCLFAYIYSGFPNRLDAQYSKEAQKYNSSQLVYRYNQSNRVAINGVKPVVLIIGDSYLGDFVIHPDQPDLGLTNHWTTLATQISEEFDVVTLSYLGCEISLKNQSLLELTKVIPGSSMENCQFTIETLRDMKFLSRVKNTILVSHRPFSYTQNTYRSDLLKYIQTRGAKNNDVFIIGNYFQLNYSTYRSCLELMFLTKSKSAEICLKNSTGFNPTVLHKELIKPDFPFDSLEYEYINLFSLLKTEDGSYAYESKGVPFMLDWNHLTPSFINLIIQNIRNYSGDTSSVIKLKRLLRVAQ